MAENVLHQRAGGGGGAAGEVDGQCAADAGEAGEGLPAGLQVAARDGEAGAGAADGQAVLRVAAAGAGNHQAGAGVVAQATIQRGEIGVNKSDVSVEQDGRAAFDEGWRGIQGVANVVVAIEAAVAVVADHAKVAGGAVVGVGDPDQNNLAIGLQDHVVGAFVEGADVGADETTTAEAGIEHAGRAVAGHGKAGLAAIGGPAGEQDLAVGLHQNPLGDVVRGIKVGGEQAGCSGVAETRVQAAIAIEAGQCEIATGGVAPGDQHAAIGKQGDALCRADAGRKGNDGFAVAAEAGIDRTIGQKTGDTKIAQAALLEGAGNDNLAVGLDRDGTRGVAIGGNQRNNQFAVGVETGVQTACRSEPNQSAIAGAVGIAGKQDLAIGLHRHAGAVVGAGGE